MLDEVDRRSTENSQCKVHATAGCHLAMDSRRESKPGKLKATDRRYRRRKPEAVEERAGLWGGGKLQLDIRELLYREFISRGNMTWRDTQIP
jgi:hypothetical protein